jgi:hypothetical protein
MGIRRTLAALVGFGLLAFAASGRQSTGRVANKKPRSIYLGKRPGATWAIALAAAYIELCLVFAKLELVDEASRVQVDARNRFPLADGWLQGLGPEALPYVGVPVVFFTFLFLPTLLQKRGLLTHGIAAVGLFAAISFAAWTFSYRDWTYLGFIVVYSVSFGVTVMAHHSPLEPEDLKLISDLGAREHYLRLEYDRWWKGVTLLFWPIIIVIAAGVVAWIARGSSETISQNAGGFDPEVARALAHRVSELQLFSGLLLGSGALVLPAFVVWNVIQRTTAIQQQLLQLFRGGYRPKAEVSWGTDVSPD